jgi:hypothetical protein
MSLVRKLKPDHNITGPLVPLSMVPIFGLTSLIFGIPTGMYTLAAMVSLFAIFYLYVFLRTRNITRLVIFAECVFLDYMFFMASGDFLTNPFNRKEFAFAYYSGMVFFALVLVYLLVTRKFKWRGREIFELAAESIEETGNGYTSRPKPVGKLDYSVQQLHAFARFCARHLIALPYITSKNITLVPIKMGEEYGRILGLSGDYRDASWVNFDVDGEVSVHISQNDYLDYREPLAFDQLCTSFGQVYIDFFEAHKNGEGIRVIDRMDDLKLGFFS